MRINFIYLLISILTLSGYLFAQGIDPGTENLTHSWTFDSETPDDTIAIDVVGDAHGILKGSGEEGRAVIENGSLFTSWPDQWMEMPADQIAINEYDEITCSILFYPIEGVNDGYTMFVYFGDTLNSTLGINYYFITPVRGGTDNTSRTAIACSDDTTTTTPWNYESYASGKEYDDGKLHHMVSTLTNDSIALYIDGILEEITPLDTNNSISLISTAFAFLGKGGYGVDPTWMGEILEFSIYNRALSSEEVLFLAIQGGITPSSVNEEITIQPQEYRLLQNYPNPFNPSTTISFSIPKKSFVSLKVFDLIGCEVATIVNSELSAGDYSRQWNPTNISSGVYFYHLHVGHLTLTKKLVYIR